MQSIKLAVDIKFKATCKNIYKVIIVHMAMTFNFHAFFAKGSDDPKWLNSRVGLIHFLEISSPAKIG